MAIGGFNGKGGNISLATFKAYVGRRHPLLHRLGRRWRRRAGRRPQQRRRHHQLGRVPLPLDHRRGPDVLRPRLAGALRRDGRQELLDPGGMPSTITR